MLLWLEERERLRALVERVRRSEYRTRVSLFKADSAHERIRRALEAIEAGDIPGAIPAYKWEGALQK